MFNFDKIDQTHLVFIYLVIFILSQNINLLKNGNLEERVIDENLGMYWKNLNGIDQKIWYANEVYLRKKLGIKTLDDQALENLRTKKRNIK